MKCGRRKVFSAALVASATCLVVVACGSDSPLSKAEFAEKSNEICKAATTERGEASKGLAKGGSGSAAEGEEVTEALLAPVRKMTEELARLNPPEGRQKQLDAIVSAFEAGIAKVEAEPAGSKTASAFSKADKLAAEAGLTSCSV